MTQAGGALHQADGKIVLELMIAELQCGRARSGQRMFDLRFCDRPMPQQQLAVLGPHFEPCKQPGEAAIAVCASNQPQNPTVLVEIELTFDEIEVDP
jgi:hypothetical protein